MHRKRKRPEDSKVELNRVITPMLDMSFQILFFFVIMYQPSAMEGQLEMALPATGTAPAPKDQKPDTSSPETEIDLPAELEVIVHTRDVESKDQPQDGSMGRIVVKDAVGEKTMDNMEELRRHLERARANLNNKEDIKVQCDGRLKYAFVVQAMDTCRKAGFNNVGFAPPPDLQRILSGLQ
jgi:biopolymer transport protein ExbD